MRRAVRVILTLAVAGSAASLSAQSFNDAISRYRSGKADCEARLRAQVERSCSEACLARATARRDQCLANVEERYRAAIRHALRPRV